jgi:hypothetical protein
MDIERIIHELTCYKPLPVEAIRAATANRGGTAPRFIEAFERFTDGSNRSDDVAKLLFLAFHLVGEWREKSAYRPLARFLRCPPEELDRVIGGAVTESSHRVMAAVFDGNPQPLYEIILDPAADQFARSRMCEAISMVTLRGEMQREHTASFLHACFAYLTPQQGCFVWNGWQSAIATLGLTELRPLVEEAFNRGSIDPTWMSLHHFDEDLEWALAHPDSPYQQEQEYTLWSDTVEELSTWWCFSEDDSDDSKEHTFGPELYLPGWLSEPAVNPYREIGRNDPCPCGSGKKFKKCCLQVLAA